MPTSDPAPGGAETAMPPRFTPLMIAAGLVLAATPALAQAWSVGRPDAQPEFTPPPPPVYKPKGKAAAAPQVVTVGPGGTPVGSVTLRPAEVQADPGSTLVEELTITARATGPAMWRVTRGGSEVVVLGAWSPLPHMLAWDQRRLSGALEGANAVLMPPEPKVGVFEGAKLMLRAGALRLPGFKPLQDQLPPELKAKFARAVTIARADPKRFAKWRPAAAGVLLLQDFHRNAGLSDLKPGTTVARLAKARGVGVRRTARLGVGGLADSILSLSQAQQFACLDAASDQVLYEAAHVRAASDAWSQGRLRDLRANVSEPVLDRCLLAQSGVRAVLDRTTGDATRAIEEALAKPGRTVAVVDLRLLDRPNGVLDRLKTAGASISVPPDAR